MINDHPVEPTTGTKIQTAVFFAFHYGFFHVGYLVFLLSGAVGAMDSSSTGRLPLLNLSSVGIAAAFFFANHLYSFIYNRQRDTKKQKIGNLMIYPYARIVPMHLTIIFGSLMGQSALLLFLALKTLADVIMHSVEHSVLRKGEAV